MAKDTTILSEKESLLLEAIIAKYGLMVSFDQIRQEVERGLSRQQVRNLVSKMSKNGWLVRIKRGSYYIASLESRGFANVSVAVIAQTLLKESYLSFEAALQYHGIFDQHLRSVFSVGLKKQTAKEIQGIVYGFVKTSRKNYYGFERVRVEGGMVNIATLEKALMDIVCFHRSIFSLDLVLEKLREHKDRLDFQKMKEYSENQSITVKKILGFLLDKAGIDSGFLFESVRKTKGASVMTSDSDLFSAKWNLYYHNHFA